MHDTTKMEMESDSRKMFHDSTSLHCFVLLTTLLLRITRNLTVVSFGDVDQSRSALLHYITAHERCKCQ